LAPGFVRSSKIAHDLSVNMKRKPTRPSEQVHACFFRRAAAFQMVAALAAGYQIVPCRISPARARQHMVKRQFGGGKLFAAILARRMVAQQNVLARERAPLKRNVYIFNQSYDG